MAGRLHGGRAGAAAAQRAGSASSRDGADDWQLVTPRDYLSSDEEAGNGTVDSAADNSSRRPSRRGGEPDDDDVNQASPEPAGRARAAVPWAGRPARGRSSQASPELQPRTAKSAAGNRPSTVSSASGWGEAARAHALALDLSSEDDEDEEDEDEEIEPSRRSIRRQHLALDDSEDDSEDEDEFGDQVVYRASANGARVSRAFLDDLSSDDDDDDDGAAGGDDGKDNSGNGDDNSEQDMEDRSQDAASPRPTRSRQPGGGSTPGVRSSSRSLGRSQTAASASHSLSLSQSLRSPTQTRGSPAPATPQTAAKVAAARQAREELEARKAAEREAKVARRKRSEVCSKIRKLETRVAALTKEVQGMLRSSSSHTWARSGELGELAALEESLQRQRQAEEKTLGEQLQKIRGLVERFQSQLRQANPSPKFVARLKATMEAVETSMQSFKSEQRRLYDSLMQEERMATREIEAFEHKLEQWQLGGAAGGAAAGTAGTTAPARAAEHNIINDLPPEVAAYEVYLSEHGGKNGGWEEYDHGIFLKHRQRLGGRVPAFLRAAQQQLPNHSAEDLEHHEAWYSKLLQLRKEKKAAIARWREAKKAEHDEALQQTEEERLQEEQAAQERRKAARAARLAEQERRKAEVEAWRQQKEQEDRERMQEEERQRRKLEIAQRKREQQHQAEVKAKAQAYGRVKAREQARAQAAAEARARAAKRQVTDEDLAAFRDRDEKRIAEQKAKKEAQEREEAEKQARLDRLRAKVQVKVERDPSRLLQPTQNQQNRAKDKSTSGGRVYARAPPRLAVPSWRAGL